MRQSAHRPTSLDHWINEDYSWDQKHDDREYAPTVMAPNAGEQEWRLPRLTRTYATAKQLFMTVEHRPLPATIVISLRDDLGKLTVTVSSVEWQSFLEPFFRLAWRSENEQPEAVLMKVKIGLIG